MTNVNRCAIHYALVALRVCRVKIRAKLRSLLGNHASTLGVCKTTHRGWDPRILRFAHKLFGSGSSAGVCRGMLCRIIFPVALMFTSCSSNNQTGDVMQSKRCLRMGDCEITEIARCEPGALATELNSPFVRSRSRGKFVAREKRIWSLQSKASVPRAKLAHSTSVKDFAQNSAQGIFV